MHDIITSCMMYFREKEMTPAALGGFFPKEGAGMSKDYVFRLDPRRRQLICRHGNIDMVDPQHRHCAVPLDRAAAAGFASVACDRRMWPSIGKARRRGLSRLSASLSREESDYGFRARLSDDRPGRRGPGA